MPCRILITVGAGLIGSHTADMLPAAGHRVRVIHSRDPQVHGPKRSIPIYLNPEIEFIERNVRDLSTVARTLQGAGTGYHLATVPATAQSMYQKSRLGIP